jgi:tripartite-type tricarboxylate transporter receptor subunit TctC
VWAADYPARPIRVTIPFPPGGTSDVLTRIIGAKLSASLGQQIVVDNRPGAGGVIATDIVAKAVPDGHTLYMTFVSHAINPYVYARLPYDTRKDFTPIALFAISPNVVVVTPTLPVKSIKELIALDYCRDGSQDDPYSLQGRAPGQCRRGSRPGPSAHSVHARGDAAN